MFPAYQIEDYYIWYNVGEMYDDYEPTKSSDECIEIKIRWWYPGWVVGWLLKWSLWRNT